MIQSFKLNTAFGIAEINTNIVKSNPPSELFSSAAVGNLFTRCQRVVRKPIRYVTIHFQDRSGAALLRCKNRAEISDPFVNRSPIRYCYCVSAQAIRYSVDIVSNLQWNAAYQFAQIIYFWKIIIMESHVQLIWF